MSALVEVTPRGPRAHTVDIHTLTGYRQRGGRALTGSGPPLVGSRDGGGVD